MNSIRFLFALSLTLMLVILLAPGAVGDPVQEKRSEASQVKSEIEAYEEEIDLVVERYNYYRYKLGETESKIETNEANLDEAEEDLDEKQERLNRRIRAIYMTGDKNSFLEVAMKAEDIGSFLEGLDFTKKVSQNDARLVLEVKESRENLLSARQQLESQKEEYASLEAQMANEKADIENSLEQRERYLSGLESDIESLLAARTATPSGSPSSRRSSPGVPVVNRTPSRSNPPGPAHGGVVSVAYAQLGKPYVYAGSGPSVFDCSGLVMYCYAQTGVSLPHSSYAQASCGTPVSVSELQPGDIVGFRGWGHVGIYVGGGQYIHAPHTGDVVRVASLAARTNYSGAVRP